MEQTGQFVEHDDYSYLNSDINTESLHYSFIHPVGATYVDDNVPESCHTSSEIEVSPKDEREISQDLWQRFTNAVKISSPRGKNNPQVQNIGPEGDDNPQVQNSHLEGNDYRQVQNSNPHEKDNPQVQNSRPEGNDNSQVQNIHRHWMENPQVQNSRPHRRDNSHFNGRHQPSFHKPRKINNPHHFMPDRNYNHVGHDNSFCSSDSYFYSLPPQFSRPSRPPRPLMQRKPRHNYNRFLSNRMKSCPWENRFLQKDLLSDGMSGQSSSLYDDQNFTGSSSSSKMNRPYYQMNKNKRYNSRESWVDAFHRKRRDAIGPAACKLIDEYQSRANLNTRIYRGGEDNAELNEINRKLRRAADLYLNPRKKMNRPYRDKKETSDSESSESTESEEELINKHNLPDFSEGEEEYFNRRLRRTFEWVHSCPVYRLTKNKNRSIRDSSSFAWRCGVL